MHNDETVISDAPDMINKTPIIPGHSPESVAGMSGSEHKNTTITTTTIVTTGTDTGTTTSNNNSPTESVSVLVPRPGPVPVGGHGTGSVPQVAEESVTTGSGCGIHNGQNGNASVTGISSDHGAGASGMSSSLSLSWQQQQEAGHEKVLNSPASTVVEDLRDNPKNNNNSVSSIGIDKGKFLVFFFFTTNFLMGIVHVVFFSFFIMCLPPGLDSGLSACL